MQATNLAILLHIATIPDLYEIGRYNIPVDVERYPDPTGGTSPRTFLPYYNTLAGAPSGVGYTMWAPYDSTALPQQFENAMGPILSALACNANSGQGASGIAANSQLTLQELQSDAQTGLGNLTGTELAGPSGYGKNVFKMPDPLSTSFWPGAGMSGIPTSIPGKVTFTGSGGCGSDISPGGKCASFIATSYVTQNDSKYAGLGRDGYSVKLISFQELNNPGTITNDGTNGSWKPPGFSGPGAAELGILQH